MLTENHLTRPTAGNRHTSCGWTEISEFVFIFLFPKEVTYFN